MLSRTTDERQNAGYIAVKRDVRIRCQMTVEQAREVAKLLIAAHPELGEMRLSRQIQFINSGGQFRVSPVCGGVLPVGITTANVQHLVDTVRESMPADDGHLAPLWADAERMAYGRRGAR